MKAFLFFAAITLSITACHRKSAPERTDSPSGSVSNPNSSTTDVKKPSVSTSSSAKALVVVDGKGTLVTSREALIANGAKTGYSATGARAFTPQERANLLARFKTVPPRVLQVPDQLAKKSAQGQYYVLRGKFWYWKKSDGFYYLDENYYK